MQVLRQPVVAVDDGIGQNDLRPIVVEVWKGGRAPSTLRAGHDRSMVLKFLMGVVRYTGNLRYGIDMCMGNVIERREKRVQDRSFTQLRG